jgi:bifunctional non-homologous end joining protein LigD
LLVQPRQRERELLFGLGAETLEVAYLAAGESLAQVVDGLHPQRGAKLLHRLGADPLDAQQRDHPRGVLRPELLQPADLPALQKLAHLRRGALADSLDEKELLGGQLAEVGPLAGDGLGRALVRAGAKGLRVPFVEDGELGELAQHVEDVLFRVGHDGDVDYPSVKKEEAAVLSIDGRAVRVTHPDKPYFSRQATLTKLDVVRYYLSVAPGALRGIRDRPLVLKRFVEGAEGPVFYQKRAPEQRPPWLRTVTLSFPSGRTAEEVVVDDAAGLAWVVNLGCIELHPHPVRSVDLDHPDELRVDLDPGPGVSWDDVRRVALEVKALLDELGLRGWPKTSGSRGMHVNVRIEPRWSFTEVRRAALALAREIERRAPQLATSRWWKEERHGVFLDYNQNAKDRTTCSAYSIRPLPDARVSAPLRWDEVPVCDAADFTVLSMPARFASLGDPHAGMDDTPGSLETLLALAARDEASGLADAPWPPNFPEMEGEAPRVAPSRAKTGAGTAPRAAAGKPRAKMPLLVVAISPDKDAALGGLARWRARHPEASGHLGVEDVLVDTMRGRSSTFTRIRVNLRHVPDEQRPSQETPDPDDDPTREWRALRQKRSTSKPG